MTPLSPGIASGCFNLLRMVYEHPMQFERLRSELPRYERLDNGLLVELAQALGWLRANDSGIAVITPAGDRILSLSGDCQRLRHALLDYVETFRPAWTMLTLDGRMRTLMFAPIEFRQSIIEAYLAQGYDSDVIEFWDRLAAIARGQRDIKLNLIGREGERLTLAYEKRRTGIDPVWRSIESCADGYDVMSVVSNSDRAQRQIEVKTSNSGISGTLHLTRNEWEVTENMQYHTFHLWDIARKEAPKLAIISRRQMEAHIPTNNGAGAWSEVEIAFEAFSAFFGDPTN